MFCRFYVKLDKAPTRELVLKALGIKDKDIIQEWKEVWTWDSQNISYPVSSLEIMVAKESDHNFVVGWVHENPNNVYHFIRFKSIYLNPMINVSNLFQEEIGYWFWNSQDLKDYSKEIINFVLEEIGSNIRFSYGLPDADHFKRRFKEEIKRLFLDKIRNRNKQIKALRKALKK